MTMGNEKIAVTLTEFQWEYLKFQEDTRTASAIEVAELQKQLMNESVENMRLQTEIMKLQETRFLSEKRDWFAGQALIGGVVSGDWDTSVQWRAKCAYQVADAMIDARGGK